MLTDRQITILHSLIKEYIDVAEPISSHLLQKKSGLDISPATIRNELQELTELGYVAQPHTSAGRVPTNKGYRYFIEITFSQDPSSIAAKPAFAKSFGEARQKIEQELKLAQELTKSLMEISSTLSYTRLQDKDTIFEMLKIIGPSRTTYDKNIDTIKKLLEEFESF